MSHGPVQAKTAPSAGGRHRASPEVVLLLVAAALVASQVTIVAYAVRLGHDPAATVATVTPIVLLLAIPSLLGVLATPLLDARPSTMPAMIAMIATGLAMRAAYAGAPAVLEVDHFRYLFEGALVASGLDPYTIAPADAASPAPLSGALAQIARDGRAVITQVIFPELRSIYPGTSQALFAIAHVILPWSLDGLRIVMGVCEAATLVLLITALRRMGRSPLLAALYWCNPLAVFTLTGQAHVDAAIPPLLVGALLAARAGRAAGTGLLLGLAVGVKIWPLLLAPLLARALPPDRRSRVVAAVVFTVTCAVVLGPLLWSMLAPASGLVAYAGGWAVNNGFFAWTAWMLDQATPDGANAERILRLGLALTAGFVALWVARRPVSDLADLATRTLVVTATLFYLSPAQFPWYANWFLPFAAVLACRPLLLASALLPIYFYYSPLLHRDAVDAFLYGLAFLHAVPVFAWLAWRWLARRRGASR